MNGELSERLFESYLDGLGLAYTQHVPVFGNKNVDFRVEDKTPILCDVNEVRPSPTDPDDIDAYSHIREDIRDLRKKFGSFKPAVSILLVTVNFSGRLYTGFSIARAMLGDVGAEVSAHARGPFHHLPRGNAAVTAAHSTLISGIFVFDCVPEGRHAIFPNPYAADSLPDACFSGVRRIRIARDASEEQLKELANITFWQCDESARTRAMESDAGLTFPIAGGGEAG